MAIDSVSIRNGTIAMVVTTPAFVLDPARMRTLTKEGGATLKAIVLEGWGAVERTDGGPVWVVEGTGQRLPLAEGELTRLDVPRAVLVGRLEIPEGDAPIAGPVRLEEVRME